MRISNDKLYELRAYIDQQQNIKKYIDKAKTEGYLTNDEFADLIREYLVSPTGYVLDTGTNGNVNAVLALDLDRQISKHNWLWKLLFRIA